MCICTCLNAIVYYVVGIAGSSAVLAADAVGAEYIETVNVGRSTSYHCKLCDCGFNDTGARDSHLRGRRHRAQYKVCYM